MSSNSRVASDAAIAALWECLVFGYEYDHRHDRFVFVSDFPLRPRRGDRAFLALVFGHVVAFERLPGTRAQDQRFGTRYGLEERGRPKVVQSVKLRDTPMHRHIELWLGPEFGGVAFKFASADAVVREARVEERSGAFVYHDLVTDEIFDCFAPFPQLLGRPSSGGR
jgi:hypothetical protein